MNRFQKQLIITLADPAFSDGDFRLLRVWLMGGGIDDALREAERIRKQLSNGSASSIGRRAQVGETVDQQLAIDVERLLLAESRLSATAAIQALASMLGSPASAVTGKRSFKDKVGALGRRHGPSRVLSAAQRIRNSRVHVPKSEWPLE